MKNKEYNFKEIEKKWQKYWEENKTFKTDIDSEKPKYFSLDMFPYPSGAGLHVGHPEGYTATDIVARMKRMQGYEVMHPIGWDAFGLPAEQYALKTGNNPKGFTEQNIDTFRRQVKSLGFSYDWDREINTTDPKYYKWTQWIFLKLFEHGLAEIKEVPVNFCPECKVVLSNEEVKNGMFDEKGHEIIQLPMRQWVLKITEYADRLLDDLEDLDWPESLKDMQRNWIGKSYGANVEFPIENDESEVIVAYTTRPDTIYGVTYVVISPESKLVDKLTTEENKDKVEKFVTAAKNKSELERTELNKDKEGVFTGSYAIHPLTGDRLPVWVGDYVIGTYGTGAVMAVPAHDSRDYEFAKKYGLELKQVIVGDIREKAFTGDGPHINSESLDNLDNADAGARAVALLEEMGAGESKINYKIRDWIFSRQRYWGEPFPIYFDDKNRPHPVDVKDLPIQLPDLEKIEPTDTGESPLALAQEWLSYKDGHLDTNTMPQWAGSCWYYIRFLDPHNDEELVNKKIADNWLPVDLYIGGAEHAVLHLLYARFWHKFLYDIGVVGSKEPFQKVYNQGMILGEDHRKMSKSLGNVINPDSIVESHGADTLRVFEMFMGPLDASIPWSDKGLDGSHKFLERVYKLYESKDIVEENKDLQKTYAQTVQKVTQDYEELSFNTAISQLMIFLKAAQKEDSMSREQAEGFVKMLSPIAPHLAEEIWQGLGNAETIAYSDWPSFNAGDLEETEVKVVVQIAGKLRKVLNVQKDLTAEALEKLARAAVEEQLEGKEVARVITVPNKLVNFVIKK